MAIDPKKVVRNAVLSDCGNYRYSLTRVWDVPLGVVAFVGLNPSTADATEDDATIRTCMRYADSWGYGGICMLNLFAFRSRNPKALYSRYANPVGPENDWHLHYLAGRATRVVACWGSIPARPQLARHERHTQVPLILPELWCLALNKDGSPHHPLYLPAPVTLKPWSPPK